MAFRRPATIPGRLMGAVVGLLAGIGAVLVLSGLAGPARPVRRSRPRLAAADLATSAGAALAAGLLGLLLTGIPVFAALSAAAGLAAPWLLRHRRRAAARRATAAAWPDAVDDLLAGIRAGEPLSAALCGLADSGPEPLRPAFAGFRSRWQRGESTAEALSGTRAELADPIADRVLVSLSLAAEAGGEQVGKVLATLADFLRADQRMRGEIDARQSWTVSGARVAVAAPWLAVAVLSLRGDSAQAYASPVGTAVLLATAVVGVIAYLVMIRLARLPGPRRLAGR